MKRSLLDRMSGNRIESVGKKMQFQTQRTKYEKAEDLLIYAMASDLTFRKNIKDLFQTSKNSFVCRMSR